MIALLLSLAVAEPPSFIRDVAPILKENCFACHDGKKRAGKYDMTTFEKLLAGGDDGAAIVPGDAAKSEAHSLMVTTETRRMPPKDKGVPVAAAQAEIIKRWIDAGAKLDTGIDPKADLIAELRRRWSPPAALKTYPHPVPITALIFSRDGKQLISGGQHELLVWEEGTLKKRIPTRSERSYGFAWVADDLAVAGGRPGQEGDLRIYSMTKSSNKRLFDTDDCVLCVTVSPDGTKLAAGGTDRLVRVWDAKTLQRPTTIDNHSDWVLGLAFSADSQFLFSASRDKTAKMWDFAKGESVFTLPEHQAIVYGVVAGEAGRGFSVGADKQLRTWKATADAKPNKTTGGHGDDVFQIARHPSKAILFTAGGDGTVRSWDAVEKLAVIKKFEGLRGPHTALAVSADGAQVAAGNLFGEIGVWSTDDAKLVRVFSGNPGRTVSAVSK